MESHKIHVPNHQSDIHIIEGSLEVKLPTIWTDEKQSSAEAERTERSEERRVEEKESEERRWRCAKR
jgi:RNase H-fold protein (predicted Holliday junction resolvase)